MCVSARARVWHSALHLVRLLRISAQRVPLILPSCFPAGEVKWRGTADLIISLITVTVSLPERQFSSVGTVFEHWRSPALWMSRGVIQSVLLWEVLLP